MPTGTVAQFQEAARLLGSPEDVLRRQAQQRRQELRSQKRETSLVLLSRDLQNFQGCWRVAGGEVSHLFDFLKVTHKKPTPAA